MLWTSSFLPRVKAASTVLFFPLYVKGVMQTEVYALRVGKDSVAWRRKFKAFLIPQSPSVFSWWLKATSHSSRSSYRYFARRMHSTVRSQCWSNALPRDFGEQSILQAPYSSFMCMHVYVEQRSFSWQVMEINAVQCVSSGASVQQNLQLLQTFCLN